MSINPPMSNYHSISFISFSQRTADSISDRRTAGGRARSDCVQGRTRLSRAEEHDVVRRPGRPRHRRHASLEVQELDSRRSFFLVVIFVIFSFIFGGFLYYSILF